MFPRRKINYLTIALMLVLVSPMLFWSLSATENSKTRKEAQKQSVLVGRVVADVFGLSDYLLVGEGSNVKHFVFGVEADAKPDAKTMLVKIKYEFFKREPTLSKEFFNYSKRYQLRAIRDRECDETVKSLSTMLNVDTSGKSLPPSDALRPLEGAPSELLTPDLLLPCYVIRLGQHRSIN